MNEGVSRRSFLKTAGLSAAAASVGGAAQQALSQQPKPDAPKEAGQAVGPGPVKASLSINGKTHDVTVEPSDTLLETLRVQLGYTGCKEVCDRAACGACSVMVDGKLIASCMMLALDAVGTKITTVEGLAQNGKLDRVQECFVKHDGMQCGFCTPGLVMACKALLNEQPKPTLYEIKRGLSGNICRCGTYGNIFNAALEASGQEPLKDAATKP